MHMYIPPAASSFTHPFSTHSLIHSLSPTSPITHIHAKFLDMKRLEHRTDDFTTIRDLYAAGVLNKVGDAVKLLDVRQGGTSLRSPIHLEVNQASKTAIEAVEKAGGTVTCVHLNKLAMRTILKPYKFQLLPRRARPNPKLMPYYLDHTRSGFLSPEIQRRNLELFGTVTSEKKYREEHENWMNVMRVELKEQRRQLLEAAGKSTGDGE